MPLPSPATAQFLTVQQALLQGADLLDKSSVSVSRLTSEVLLAHALRKDRPYLYAHSTDRLTELQWIHYGRYLNERLQGKPTQYITHKQEFYARDFYVDENVLIPRPETEHLVEAALTVLREKPDGVVLDVGTGSGAIAVTLALELARPILASDISLSALRIAERNRAAHQAAVRFFAGDLLSAVAPSSIDLLVSNPPYVPGADAANMQSEVRDWEPPVALFAGDSGLEIYRRLIADAQVAVRSGGTLLMELGYQSLAGVRELLAGAWSDIRVEADLAGFPRLIRATLNK